MTTFSWNPRVSGLVALAAFVLGVVAVTLAAAALLRGTDGASSMPMQGSGSMPMQGSETTMPMYQGSMSSMRSRMAGMQGCPGLSS
jgi:ABC-type phosphate transport system substrate-binding protein